MIKLVAKKPEENKVYRSTCDKCGATFEFENDDAYVGELGCYYVPCPNCHTDVYVDEFGALKLDENNIQFPVHFWKCGNGVNIEDEQIQQWVKEGLSKIKENDDMPYWFVGSGNTRVIVFNFEDEYEVIVAKNYYSCDIFK